MHVLDQVFDVLSGTADGVFAVDRQQRILFWNRAARNILGFVADEVVGRPCHEVIHGTSALGAVVCREHCPASNGAARGKLIPARDLEVQTKGGKKRWINVSTFVFPAKWRGTCLLVHVFRDIGRQTHVDAELERALRELVPQTMPQASAVPPRHAALTHREGQILRALATGASTGAICEGLGIQESTARTHVQRILSKLDVHSRLEAVALAQRLEIL